MIELIEPHKEKLSQPNDEQLLYKIISIEHLISSISKSYLHFNRVDKYGDFHNADKHDGEQLPQDRAGNTASKFIKAPDVSVADFYEQFRQRTYACCFSLENSNYIWKKYGGDKGKVCLVFKFGKLREMLNEIITKAGIILNNGLYCKQSFFINYGLVEYVDLKTYQLNTKYLPNPIQYIYIKDKCHYEEDEELRISLSTMYGFVQNGRKINFPDSIPLHFDFKAAMVNDVIQKIEDKPGCDRDFLFTKLQKLGIDLISKP